MEANNERRQLIRNKIRNVLEQREQGGVDYYQTKPVVNTQENTYVNYNRNGMTETEMKVTTSSKPGMRKIQMNSKSFTAGRPPMNDFNILTLSFEQRKYLKEKLNRIKLQRSRQRPNSEEKVMIGKLERLKRGLKRILRMKAGESDIFDEIYDINAAGSLKIFPNTPNGCAGISFVNQSFQQTPSIQSLTPSIAAPEIMVQQSSFRNNCLMNPLNQSPRLMRANAILNRHRQNSRPAPSAQSGTSAIDRARAILEKHRRRNCQ